MSVPMRKMKKGKRKLAVYFETAAKPEQGADHDDLPENQGMDKRHPVIREDDVMRSEQ